MSRWAVIRLSSLGEDVCADTVAQALRSAWQVEVQVVEGYALVPVGDAGRCTEHRYADVPIRLGDGSLFTIGARDARRFASWSRHAPSSTNRLMAHVLMPTSHIDGRFAAADPELDEEETPSEPEAERTFEQDVSPFIECLPERQAEVLRLHLSGMSQQQIATQLGVTQPDVSYRLRVARERIRRFRALPLVTVERARKDLGETLSSEDIDVLCAVVRTHSQSRVARELGVRSQRVCEQWARVRRVIESMGVEPYVTLVRAVPRRKRGSNDDAA